MAKGMKGFGNWMTKAINSIDGIGWGRSGAGVGAVVGGLYGGVSDNGTVLGGAAKGSVIGFGGGKLARFGSSFKGIRNAEQMQTYKDKSMDLSYGKLMAQASEGIEKTGKAYTGLKDAATAAFP